MLWTRLIFNSVETLPNLSARVAFQVNSSAVFKEDVNIVPVVIDDTLSYMPWGGDNNMPFDILKLIEDDETLSTCQMFNAEVCFGERAEKFFSAFGLPRRYLSDGIVSNRMKLSNPITKKFVPSYFVASFKPAAIDPDGHRKRS